MNKIIVNLYLRKKLNFDFKYLTYPDLLFGTIGLVSGFWYLHWVESPIYLNALFYSPLGTINCPTTTLTICALLCLTNKSKSRRLEIVIILVVCALFLIFRNRKSIDNKKIPQNQ